MAYPCSIYVQNIIRVVCSRTLICIIILTFSCEVCKIDYLIHRFKLFYITHNSPTFPIPVSALDTGAGWTVVLCGIAKLITSLNEILTNKNEISIVSMLMLSFENL